MQYADQTEFILKLRVNMDARLHFKAGLNCKRTAMACVALRQNFSGVKLYIVSSCNLTK